MNWLRKDNKHISRIDVRLEDFFSKSPNPDNMPPKSKRVRVCPSCGQMPVAGERICRNCGKELKNSGSKSGKSNGHTPKPVKVPCPSCGVLISKRSKRCPLCKAELHKVSDKVEIPPSDRGPSEVGAKLIGPEAKGAAEEGKRTLCPTCQAVIEGTELKCPICGTPLRDEAKTTEPVVPVAPESAERPSEIAETIEDLAKQPEPLAHVDEVPVKEPPEAVEVERKEPEPASLIDAVLAGELPGKAEVEEKPAEPTAPVDLTPLGEPPQAVKDEDVPKETTTPAESKPAEELPETDKDEKKPAEPTAPVDTTLTIESLQTVNIVEGGESHSCPSCGAIVPKSFPKCPLCNESLIGAAPRAEEVRPPVGPPETPRPAESVVSAVKAERKEAKKSGSRRVKSEKTTLAPVAPSAKAAGRVNGLGRTNGRGFVNGTGIVEGRAFVNGTGISNGLGPRQRRGAPERRELLTRWQLLAVLVAIVIIVPAFLYLTQTDKADKISIDGDYSDWDGATIYGTKIPSAAPSSNITEWAVEVMSSDLFVFFRTEATMMSSSDPESYYLFVDSDGSNTTGYIMGSTGADYMLRVTGWDSAVNSKSLLEYTSDSDQYDWNSWKSIGSLSCSLDGERMEASARIPQEVGQSAKFVLASKDSVDRGSVSYAAPLKGGVLVVRQEPAVDVAATGLITSSASAAVLTLRFTCEGEGGEVTQVNPVVAGAPLAYQVPGFVLERGEMREVTVALDTHVESDGRLISAEVLPSSIASTFPSVEIIGSGVRAYAGFPPSDVSIDGAFADWIGRLSADVDSIPVTIPGVDIDQVGNSSTSLSSSFYVSVEGEMCSGTYVPAAVVKPSGTGGGAVIPTRRTAEDILNVYVDSDKSTLTGEVVAIDSMQIGADQKIEVRGLFCVITSMRMFDFSASSGTWVANAELVEAAKDDKRIEIGVSAMSLGGSGDVDFIIETTSWKGRGDLAVVDTSSFVALTKTWVVDPTSASPYATSMSYQRKMLYDGVNHWSFFFDGANTVYKYSTDEGQTWTYGGSVFVTQGVNETSIWYDSSTSTLYAVGDTSKPSDGVLVQIGTVDAAAHTIAWASSDSGLRTSTYPLAGKNTYISKDLNGYLWVLSSNFTDNKLLRYQLSAFRSTVAGSAGSWVNTGQLLPWASGVDNAKGSILPAGSGSDMWAIYAFQGAVMAGKYTGVWQTGIPIYGPAGSTANTDNSPPSAVVDGKGVVHVVYGTGRKSGQASIPQIFYSRNNSGLTTFTAGLNLDPANDSLGVANHYPTISLESSTDSLYVLWLQCDSTFAAKTVIGRKCVSGTWSGIAIADQTSYTKQYLTSIYSVSGEFKICWQWTQNTTAPMQVLYDSLWIPEFSDFTPLVVVTIVILAIFRLRSRSKDGQTE